MRVSRMTNDEADHRFAAVPVTNEGSKIAIPFFLGLVVAAIVSLLAGATFHTGSMFSRHGKKVMFRVQGEEYELDHVGLLHVCGTNTEGWETYFPNSMLASTPISIKRVKIN